MGASPQTPANAAALARPRMRSYLALVGTLVLLGYAIERLNIDLERLVGMLGRIGTVLTDRYLPPNYEHILQPDYLHTVLETLEMTWFATVIGLLLAVPLAWLSAGNLTPSPRLLRPVARLVIMGVRAVHEMIWAIILVSLVGFGMLAGSLALVCFCVGFAGKLFSESLEAIDPGPIEALRASGAGSLQVFWFAALPQVRQTWAGISIYSIDAVFRAATVVGFFGAGGMGWFLRQSTQLVASHDVAAIVLSIMLVVIVSELASTWLRHRLDQSPA